MLVFETMFGDDQDFSPSREGEAAEDDPNSSGDDDDSDDTSSDEEEDDADTESLTTNNATDAWSGDSDDSSRSESESEDEGDEGEDGTDTETASEALESGEEDRPNERVAEPVSRRQRPYVTRSRHRSPAQSPALTPAPAPASVPTSNSAQASTPAPTQAPAPTPDPTPASAPASAPAQTLTPAPVPVLPDLIPAFDREDPATSGPEEQDLCPICTNPITDAVRATTFPCLHNFCVACLKTWLPQHNRCPLCNLTVSYLIVDVRPDGTFSTIPVVWSRELYGEPAAAVRAGTAIDFIWTGAARHAPASVSAGGHTVRARSPRRSVGSDDGELDLPAPPLDACVGPGGRDLSSNGPSSVRLLGTTAQPASRPVGRPRRRPRRSRGSPHSDPIVIDDDDEAGEARGAPRVPTPTPAPAASAPAQAFPPAPTQAPIPTPTPAQAPTSRPQVSVTPQPRAVWTSEAGPSAPEGSRSTQVRVEVLCNIANGAEEPQRSSVVSTETSGVTQTHQLGTPLLRTAPTQTPTPAPATTSSASVRASVPPPTPALIRKRRLATETPLPPQGPTRDPSPSPSTSTSTSSSTNPPVAGTSMEVDEERGDRAEAGARGTQTSTLPCDEGYQPCRKCAKKTHHHLPRASERPAAEPFTHYRPITGLSSAITMSPFLNKTVTGDCLPIVDLETGGVGAYVVLTNRNCNLARALAEVQPSWAEATNVPFIDTRGASGSAPTEGLRPFGLWTPLRGALLFRPDGTLYGWPRSFGEMPRHPWEQ
nr:ubiquitin E3 ligase ICP0 [Macropodid alphaherpesvirus 2]